MPCCDTGRNVQKYKGGGGGASTLQEALENGNIATVAIELQSNGLFIGDGGGLSNIAGVGGSVGNMQQVTTSGATTSNKIILTNTNESLETSGNINVGNNKFYLGDGGLLSNTAGTVTLQQASNQGNVINNTVSFTNAAESIVTTGKIVVGTSLEATNVNGNGSGLSSLNASNVSTGTLSTSRGGTGNTFSSASKSDLLVGTSGGTFATLSIPSSSASGKVLKINTSDELYWGADNTSSGGGGGGSGVLSLGSSYMSYASGTDYNTSTGETIDLDASTSDTASHIVVRDANKNINVTKVTLGSNTLTETEYSGKSSTVTVGNDNSGTERDLAFVDGNSILKDDGGKLKWKPNPGELYIGPSSGTRTKLTNTKWFGESAKVTINNTTGSSVASPVLMHEADGIVRKDTSNRLTWTATGTHAGTLTIGTIGGTHSNITSTTFTGTATKVTINNDDNDNNTNTRAIPYVNGTDLDSKAGTFHYKPSDGTLTAAKFSGALTGTATKVTVNNDDNDNNASTLAIPYVNSTDLDSKAATFHYKPSTGTLTATTFSGNLPATNITGEVPVGHGGTGLSTISANHILIGNGANDINTLAPESSTTTKFLSSSTSSGGAVTLEWASPSVSQISIGDDTTSTTDQPILYANDHGTQDIESDKDTLHYKRPTGTLTTSNLITSDTSTNARNGIANTAPDHTLSVGTVVSIQETSTGDVLIVRGDGYFNDDVYIAKKLTMPSGSTLVADTIKVRSHNVKETMVVAERPESQLSA